MADINHVALQVRDPARSLTFYRDVIGLEGRVREADFGYAVTTPNGISFSLIRGEPPEAVGEFHFGVGAPSAEAMEARRRELQALGVREVDWWVEPGFVSLKVADPDGYVVEISWDQASQA